MRTWHLVTGEYPPAPGGVSDYCQAVAEGLAAAGDVVHVWCPASGAAPPAFPNVVVHAEAGTWSASDLQRLDRELNRIQGVKRLLVQWVPHAYGHRSLNVGFCRWIRRRAKAGDVVDLMIHEPGMPFREGTLKHDAAAVVHRLMLALLLSHASRVWVAIPAWTDALHPWTLGHAVNVAWLPIPSTIPVEASAAEVYGFRMRTLVRADGVIVGHFSTYPPAIREALQNVLVPLLSIAPEMQVQLIGRGSDAFAAEVRSSAGIDANRINASGELSASALSSHLQGCDCLLQPYPDGATSRRTTLMAALAHGVPVATTVGRLSEAFWQTSGAVVAVPADDHEAMRRAVLDLVRQPDRRGSRA